MKQELQQKLFDKYPKIFQKRNLSMTQTCMYWGIETEDGWERIIELLCEALTYTYSTGMSLDSEEKEKYKVDFLNIDSPQVIATQVKSKFGTLRFYYRLEFDEKLIEINKSGKYPGSQRIIDCYVDYIDGIVHMAEVLSSYTCEVSGEPGELCVKNGWYKTLCPEQTRAQGYITIKEQKKQLEEKERIKNELDSNS